jgi:hypothetical protein
MTKGTEVLSAEHFLGLLAAVAIFCAYTEERVMMMVIGCLSVVET